MSKSWPNLRILNCMFREDSATKDFHILLARLQRELLWYRGLHPEPHSHSDSSATPFLLAASLQSLGLTIPGWPGYQYTPILQFLLTSSLSGLTELDLRTQAYKDEMTELFPDHPTDNDSA